MRIDVIVFNGFDELDALGPYEVFANAAQGGADVDVALVAFGGQTAVTGSHGVTVQAHRAPGAADIVVVPGGGWMDGNADGARAEVARGEIPAYLRERHEAGATIAGVCTGVMIVASSGLLEGRPAITHHGAIADLDAAGAIVTRRRVVDDGDIVTAGGVTSGIDLALHVVEREWGATLADAVAREMEHTRRVEAVTA